MTLRNSYSILDPDSQYYYPYALGGKTGYASSAGQCFVCVAEKNGRTLISVVLTPAEPRPPSGPIPALCWTTPFPYPKARLRPSILPAPDPPLCLSRNPNQHLWVKKVRGLTFSSSFPIRTLPLSFPFLAGPAPLCQDRRRSVHLLYRVQKGFSLCLQQSHWNL